MPGTSLNPLLRKTQHQKVYKVLIADDHDIFRHGLKSLLNKYPFLAFKGEASNGKDLKTLVTKEKPDLIFVDLHMPGGHGTDATAEIRKEYPNIKIIVLSFYDDALTVERLIKLGASAYLTKNISVEILDAMFEKVLNGQPFISPDAASNVAMSKILPIPAPSMPEQSQWLLNEVTPREKQVLKMLTEGSTQKEIASELNLSPRTIESHKEKLMKRLGAKNLAELISVAHQYKLV
jgi:DNA-binding NarL/FixJ family response regulator